MSYVAAVLSAQLLVMVMPGAAIDLTKRHDLVRLWKRERFSRRVWKESL